MIFASTSIIPLSYAFIRSPSLYTKATSKGLTALNDLAWTTALPLTVETMHVWIGSMITFAYFDHAMKWPRSGFRKVEKVPHLLLQNDKKEYPVQY